MLECEISFDPTASLVFNLSPIFAGLSVLEAEHRIKIKRINQVFDFKKSGKYPNRLIFEIKAEGKTIALDISDGYQDIHSPEFMDNILDGVDYYFKTSYDVGFADKLRNKDKFKRFGLIFGCSCSGNHYEKEMAKYYFRSKQFKQSAYWTLKCSEMQEKADYRNFECDRHFDSYNLLFWTRLWKAKKTPVENLLKYYPELTLEQAKEKSEKQYEMFKETNAERISALKLLKKELGDRYIGGLSDTPESRTMAPDLITSDERIISREGYLNTMKGNVVNVLSKGLHGCIGARYGETLAAGRAFLTDKLKYSLVGDFSDKKNYIEYSDAVDLVDNAIALLDDVDTIHRIETNNHEYYQKYIRPDVLLSNVLSEVFSEQI